MSMDAKWYASWIRLLPASTADEKMRNLEAADMLEDLDKRIKQYEQDTNGLWFLSGLDKPPVRLNCSARWISMEEGRPAVGETVLVCDYHGGFYVVTYTPNRLFEDDYGYSHYFDDYTHWMPLPEPPEEGEE